MPTVHDLGAFVAEEDPAAVAQQAGMLEDSVDQPFHAGPVRLQSDAVDRVQLPGYQLLEAPEVVDDR